jgi:hypothetical protein
MAGDRRPSRFADSLSWLSREQETHLRTVPFQEEFRAFLARSEVEDDERYVWH